MLLFFRNIKFFHQLALFLLIFLSACQKQNKEPTVYKVSGRLIQNCTNPMPIANQEIRMYSESTFSIIPKIDKVTTTDENGNFSFGYTKVNGVNSSTTLVIDHVLRDLPALQCLDLGDIPLEHSASAQLKIKVENTYSSDDTLFVLDQFTNNPLNYKMIMAGPFSDTLFASQTTSSLVELFYQEGKFFTNIAGSMYIQSNGVQVKTFYKKESVENCNTAPYVLEVVID